MRISLPIPTHRRVRWALASLTVWAVLLQALAPPGYMAGPLENGWPVVVCPEGMPAGFMPGFDSGGHDSHQQHDHGDHDNKSATATDGSCLLAGVLDGSLLPDAGEWLPATHRTPLRPRAAVGPAPVTRLYTPHQSRAPPVSA
jgi:hypothetical protein